VQAGDRARPRPRRPCPCHDRARRRAGSPAADSAQDGRAGAPPTCALGQPAGSGIREHPALGRIRVGGAALNLPVLEDAERVAVEAADLLAEAISSETRTLVLAGGSTPRRAYQLLAGRSLEWGRVTVLFGDERCTPPDDPESNYRMAKEELLDRVHPGGVLRMPAELGAEEGAALYDVVVRAFSPLGLVL